MGTDAVHDQRAKQKPEPTPRESGRCTFSRL